MRRYATAKNLVVLAIIVVLVLLAWSIYATRRKKPTVSTLSATGAELGLLGTLPGFNFDMPTVQS